MRAFGKAEDAARKCGSGDVCRLSGRGPTFTSRVAVDGPQCTSPPARGEIGENRWFRGMGTRQSDFETERPVHGPVPRLGPRRRHPAPRSETSTASGRPFLLPSGWVVARAHPNLDRGHSTQPPNPHIGLALVSLPSLALHLIRTLPRPAPARCPYWTQGSAQGGEKQGASGKGCGKGRRRGLSRCLVMRWTAGVTRPGKMAG